MSRKNKKPQNRIIMQGETKCKIEQGIDQRILLTCLSRYIYEGFEKIPSKPLASSLEKLLYTNGKVGFYNDENFGLIFGNITPQDYNLYNEPLTFLLTTPTFTKIVNRDEIVIMENNSLRLPTLAYISNEVDNLIEAYTSLKVALKQSRTPLILGSTKSQLLSSQIVKESIENGDTAIVIVDENFSSEVVASELVPKSSNYNIIELNNIIRQLWDSINDLLGIKDEVSRASGVSEAELEISNTITDIVQDNFYNCRIKALEEIKEKFGFEIILHDIRHEEETNNDDKDNKDDKGGNEDE